MHLFLVCVVMDIKTRALGMLGKGSLTELYPRLCVHIRTECYAGYQMHLLVEDMQNTISLSSKIIVIFNSSCLFTNELYCWSFQNQQKHKKYIYFSSICTKDLHTLLTESCLLDSECISNSQHMGKGMLKKIKITSHIMLLRGDI